MNKVSSFFSSFHSKTHCVYLESEINYQLIEKNKKYAFMENWDFQMNVVRSGAAIRNLHFYRFIFRKSAV